LTFRIQPFSDTAIPPRPAIADGTISGPPPERTISFSTTSRGAIQIVILFISPAPPLDRRRIIHYKTMKAPRCGRAAWN